MRSASANVNPSWSWTRYEPTSWRWRVGAVMSGPARTIIDRDTSWSSPPAFASRPVGPIDPVSVSTTTSHRAGSACGGHDEGQRLGAGVDDDEERVVIDLFTPAVDVDRRAPQPHHERLREAFVPVLVGHEAAVGAVPLDVGDVLAVVSNSSRVTKQPVSRRRISNS